MITEKFFTKALLNWNKNVNKREMPWKYETDPYKIWISEIILQQTRVSQGLEYYNRFILRFPNINSLATASEAVVFKHWEGLGYYTRCKNIIATAKYISGNLKGIFPNQYDAILQLKGIGSYTASAIASFAYNLPYAVLDGNVFRLLSRFFGVHTAVDSLEGKRFFNSLAQELLDKNLPGRYNQAIMDFGATVCKPVPSCEICPLNKRCIAFASAIQLQLPVKEKKIVKRTRWFYFLVVRYRNKEYIRKREAKDIWQNLYEYILLEMPGAKTTGAIQASKEFRAIFKGTSYTIGEVSVEYQQQLTHQTIVGRFITITVKRPLGLENYQLASADDIKRLPFPKFITTYLKD